MTCKETPRLFYKLSLTLRKYIMQANFLSLFDYSDPTCSWAQLSSERIEGVKQEFFSLRPSFFFTIDTRILARHQACQMIYHLKKPFINVREGNKLQFDSTQR